MEKSIVFHPDIKGYGGLDNLLGELKIFIKTLMKESLEDVFGDKLIEMEFNNKTISSDDLCKRWGCNKNTLRNKEKNHIITPFKRMGKVKMYSMGDVLEAEDKYGIYPKRA